MKSGFSSNGSSEKRVDLSEEISKAPLAFLWICPMSSKIGEGVSWPSAAERRGDSHG
jgi:hypothetical protein